MRREARESGKPHWWQSRGGQARDGVAWLAQLQLRPTGASGACGGIRSHDVCGRELLVTLSAHMKRKLAQNRKPNQEVADPKAAPRYSHGQLGFKEPALGKLPHSNA